jgi:hypothetical protein
MANAQSATGCAPPWLKCLSQGQIRHSTPSGTGATISVRGFFLESVATKLPDARIIKRGSSTDRSKPDGFPATILLASGGDDVKQYRTSLASLLIIVLIALGAPALGIGGGCDEPGYTGGSCGKAENQGPGSGGGGGGLDDEPGEPAGGGGGGGGQTLPSAGPENASASASSIRGTLTMMARSVLDWLFVSSLP